MANPFDGLPEARMSEFDVAKGFGRKPAPRCDVASKPRRKKTDLNPHERKWLEANGWTYARVEHTNAFGGVSVDLWGCADFLAIRGDETVLVQVTDITSASKRERKIKASPEALVWMSGGGRRFEIHAWHQPKGPGTKWEMRVREVRP